MPIHNVQCSKCGVIIMNHFAAPWPDSLQHEADGGELVILWQDPSPPRPASVHPRERSVVWRDRQGHTVYPPRNDSAIPERYRRQGYERVEFQSLRELERFEKEAGVRSHKAWYDDGSGHSEDED